MLVFLAFFFRELALHELKCVYGVLALGQDDKKTKNTKTVRVVVFVIAISITCHESRTLVKTAWEVKDPRLTSKLKNLGARASNVQKIGGLQASIHDDRESDFFWREEH